MNFWIARAKERGKSEEILENFVNEWNHQKKITPGNASRDTGNTLENVGFFEKMKLENGSCSVYGFELFLVFLTSLKRNIKGRGVTDKSYFWSHRLSVPTKCVRMLSGDIIILLPLTQYFSRCVGLARHRSPQQGQTDETE